MTRVRTAALGLVIVASTSCVDEDGAVGVRALASDDIEVLFFPCGYEDLSEARLFRVRGEYPAEGKDDLLASAGPLKRVSTRSQGGAAYSVRIRLDDELPLHTRHAVTVGDASFSFLPSQLRTDRVRAGDGLVSPVGLVEMVASECGPGDPMAVVRFFGGVAFFVAASILGVLIIGAAVIFLSRWAVGRRRVRRMPSRPDL